MGPYKIIDYHTYHRRKKKINDIRIEVKENTAIQHERHDIDFGNGILIGDRKQITTQYQRKSFLPNSTQILYNNCSTQVVATSKIQKTKFPSNLNDYLSAMRENSDH